MIFAAWLLLVTGIYTGTLAPGSEVEVRFESETKSQAVCQALEQSIVRTLTAHGATDIRTARCPKR